MKGATRRSLISRRRRSSINLRMLRSPSRSTPLAASIEDFLAEQPILDVALAVKTYGGLEGYRRELKHLRVRGCTLRCGG